MTEMLAILPGVAYAARGSVVDPAHIGKAKAMIKRACQAQIKGEGFAIVEVLSNCPVGWGMTAQQSMEHLAEWRRFIRSACWWTDPRQPDLRPRSWRPEMEHSVVFAGFGGQGLLFAGQILARAAIADGLEVFWIPSYGPEMRGGTASCTVIVGEEEIGSPVVDRYDAAVVMNPPIARQVRPGGRRWRAADRQQLARRQGLCRPGRDRRASPAVHGAGRHCR